MLTSHATCLLASVTDPLFPTDSPSQPGNWGVKLRTQLLGADTSKKKESDKGADM
jgi:hypothetical protein